jgi:hypothetical protein
MLGRRGREERETSKGKERTRGKQGKVDEIGKGRIENPRRGW